MGKNQAINKVGCVFPMVVVSILLHAEFGPNDHREDASHFRKHSSSGNMILILETLFKWKHDSWKHHY